MRIIESLKKGVKIKIFECLFCIVVGTDQISPSYIRFTTTFQQTGHIKFCEIMNQSVVKPQPKSLYKNNFGKRVNFK
jgi:hypothetical protein